MNWTGKLIGALLGFILTRRPMGVLLGLFLGHLYDQYAARGHAGSRADPATVRATFFRAAFTIMGHVAKSDGRVSEQDIAAARRIFRQFNLGEADTRAAMEFYTLGKRPDFDAEEMLAELAAACRGRPDVLRMFLEIQMRAALMGDGLQGASRETLARSTSSARTTCAPRSCIRLRSRASESRRLLMVSPRRERSLSAYGDGAPRASNSPSVTRTASFSSSSTGRSANRTR